jgi:hypothetical protein
MNILSIRVIWPWPSWSHMKPCFGHADMCHGLPDVLSIFQRLSTSQDISSYQPTSLWVSLVQFVDSSACRWLPPCRRRSTPRQMDALCQCRIARSKCPPMRPRIKGTCRNLIGTGWFLSGFPWLAKISSQKRACSIYKYIIVYIYITIYNDISKNS